jgi:UDP-glucose 4-epimerase
MSQLFDLKRSGNMRNRRVLITGGAGFIGTELTRQICALGNSVIVVDNLINGKRQNLEALPIDRVQLVVSDIRDGKRMADLMRSVDIVLHLACLGVRHSIHSPLENQEVNATATLNLLSVAKATGVKRFVYVSSSEVYGTARWVPMTEEHPTYPMTVYGASKLAGESYTRAFYYTYGYPTVVVRPFNSYGQHCHHEGDSGEVIPKFVLRSIVGKPMIVFGDGTQTRDFTYVCDTARAILMAGTAEAAVGQTINVGTGSEICINALAHEVARTVGRPNREVIYDDPRPGDVLRLYADISKARQLLGFEPEVTLQEGLVRLRDWYLDRKQPLEALLKEEVVHNWNPKEIASGV